jgi:ParB-like chromosome segregation protein Spo0J
VQTVEQAGVIEPVVVTPNDFRGYDLVAGEGRFLRA